ncbi:Nit6803 family nitrilase [Methylobacterium sp. Leaf108]|uniref:Nit6803 family nitrilase n=1 Tax=Methylobacterium sp. Leaf108 TaxID=1736256 RepID=UPI0006FD9DFC|nr:Nit6803 family nitrilase [Methylobacterium sp. Leaf108]KQP61304.1 aliphatic nitrilase [Methylobacterium sp. Leaf108]
MSEQRIVRAAAVQIAPDLNDPAATLDRVLAAIDEAAGKGARFIVFPETFVPYYPYFSFIAPPAAQGPAHLRLYEGAVTVPGPVTQAVSAAARKAGAVIVLGVNERDHGSLYNAQLVFDADGALLLKRRKITPTYHERMVWGQGDGAGLTVVETAVGRVGALACWEHYNPLARYALMAQHEEIHAAQFPGSMVGQVFADQMEVTIRHHALEAGAFVVNATGWLRDDQIAAICPDETLRGALRGGNCTAIVSPEGRHLAPPMTQGEGILIADMDMALVTKRKRMMDSVGHYARPELLSLNHDARPARTVVTTRDAPPHDRSQTHERQCDERRFDERQPASDHSGHPGRHLGPAPSGHADGAPDQRLAVVRGQAG